MCSIIWFTIIDQTKVQTLTNSKIIFFIQNIHPSSEYSNELYEATKSIAADTTSMSTIVPGQNGCGLLKIADSGSDSDRIWDGAVFGTTVHISTRQRTAHQVKHSLGKPPRYRFFASQKYL